MGSMAEEKGGIHPGEDRTAMLASVCQAVVAADYEETDVINVGSGTVCPLLERPGVGGGLFGPGEQPYDDCIRRLIHGRACGPADREQLSALVLGRLLPDLRREGRRCIRCQLKGECGAPETGVWKQIECVFFPNEEARILVLVSDVQADEDTKAQLREAAEEAQAASRAKSAFLANMSHEIRTPMNAIVGISEVLLRKELPKEILNSISTIQNSGTSLLGIINDILDFSKIETGKFEIVDVEYMLPSLLMDISNVISVRLASKPIYFMMDINPALPNYLVGDDIRIKQILMNLIGNSVKFTHEGCIELRVRGHALEGDRFEMSFDVSDTGIGIKEEDLGKLFNTFSQVDTRKNRATTGSGLGLAISRNLARLMGGDLTVQSTYGKGSVFSVRIVQRVTRYVPLGEVKDKAVRMLICEQNESIVRGLSRTMEQLGLSYEVCREYDHVRDYPGMSHVLLRRKNFPKLQEKLEFMFDKGNILLMLDNDEQPEGDWMDYKQLQLPLITLQLINALNGEEIVTSVRKKSFDRSEIVPLTYARILVVDDNTTNLQVAKGLMMPYRMQIDTTTSGFKAIEMVKKTRYDAIFMDHMMPEMDGIETARYIRSMEGDYYRQVPIIALTANAMSDARDLFLEVGMDDFVAKPIEMRELHRVIKKYIQSKAPEGYLESVRRQAAQPQAAAPEKAPEGAAAKGAPAVRLAAAPADGALTLLLQQNNALLRQNMTLLNALLGTPAPEAPAAPAEPAPQPAPPAAPDIPAEPADAVRDFIPGVDMQKSIETYGGSVAVYHNILRTYSLDIREKEKALREYLDREDISNFTIQAHALKSASRGVGAFDLGEDAFQLEKAGKAGDMDGIKALYPAFEEKLRQMIANVGGYVKKYLGNMEDDVGESADAFDPELLEKLRAACEQMDYLEAENILKQMRKNRYPEELDQKLDRLLDCCRAFDYDQLEALVLKL